MQDFVGKHIDRYRITERLGMGGMAVVYKAYDTRLERDVALKLIRTSEIPESQHERLMKRFEREAKAQARFDHKHIVHIYDYGEVEGSPYLVMAYIPGGTLKVRTGQPIPYQQAIRWLIPVADALSYAHEFGVIHRDIKPSNILFDSKDQPILTDFGIAKILETDEATLTGTGLGVGTPEYMAPEQWQGKASHATDQYALGVVLYELLTGQKPYTADTPVAVAFLQMSEPLRSPKAIVPGIPESVDKLLYKAMAKDHLDRFTDMALFRKAMEKQLEVKISEPVQPSKTVQSPTTTKAVKPTPIPVSEAETIDVLDDSPVIEELEPEMNHMAISDAPQATEGTQHDIQQTIMQNASSEHPPEGESKNKFEEIHQQKIREKVTIGTNSEKLIIQLSPDVHMTFVHVPAGEFWMGSDDKDARKDEKPMHKVYLDEYWIGLTTVTNQQYKIYSESMGKKHKFSKDKDNHPAVKKSWHDSIEFCKWLSEKSGKLVRLPTEAEWEKAARGIDKRRYPWGNQSPTSSLANYGCSVGGTSPVGSYPEGASPYSALDMAGNVWEWVVDLFHADYYKSALFKNPTGSASGDVRVLRGGSWYVNEWILRVSYRYWYDPVSSGLNLGFRCLCTP